MKKQDKENGIEKTNVCRILDQKGIDYKSYCYVDSGAVNGMEAAQAMGQNPDRVFKTLVTVGHRGEHYVFVIPVNQGLDLKKAAEAVNEKSIEMVKSKELLGLTGYIHGGCSPIGMKKFFKTTIDETAQLFDTILFSAGKIGYQVEVAPADLEKVIEYSMADLCV